MPCSRRAPHSVSSALSSYTTTSTHMFKHSCTCTMMPAQCTNMPEQIQSRKSHTAHIECALNLYDYVCTRRARQGAKGQGGEPEGHSAQVGSSDRARPRRACAGGHGVAHAHADAWSPADRSTLTSCKHEAQHCDTVDCDASPQHHSHKRPGACGCDVGAWTRRRLLASCRSVAPIVALASLSCLHLGLLPDELLLCEILRPLRILQKLLS